MKIIRYILLILFSLIWIAGCSPDILSYLYKNRWIPDDYRFGDLYRLSNLDAFKEPQKACDSPLLPSKPASVDKEIHLYVLGDSFLEPQRVSKEDFITDKYQYIHWNQVMHISLDTTAINLLVIESVERHLREHLAAPITNLVADTATFFPAPAKPRFMTRMDQAFSSEKTEERLATILFEYAPFLSIKEMKAAFNWRVFDRVNDKVAVSDDKSSIVYYLDTDSTLISSSFNPVNNEEIDLMVKNLNSSANELKLIGFDEVLFSVIPNKTTVLMPEYGSYNQLIQRVQTHPRLSVPYIDILQEFNQMGASSYLKGDSHWTCEGQHRWLLKINEKLLQHISGTDLPSNYLLTSQR